MSCDQRELPGYISPYVRPARTGAADVGKGVSAETSYPQASASPKASGAVVNPAVPAESALSPIEQVEQGIERIQADVAADLLMRLHAQEPAFFEQAVLDLLMAMGYGGAEGRATRTQLVNDGGIDGIIDQDALGLSRVYVHRRGRRGLLRVS